MKSLVDRSKPSTACGPCRKRRAKCDRRRPQCSQCIKTSRTCSGYRDSLELLLRDETHKFTQENQKFDRETQSDPGDSTELHRRTPSTISLKQNSTDLAVGFFTSSFANGCYMDYLPQLYMSANKSVQFDASFEAVALSFLAKRDGRHDLQRSAFEKYSIALNETTQALSIPEEAVKDDNIASVMLLALFAALSSSPAEASKTWTRHINGALALLLMRAPGSYGNYTFQRILLHVVSSIQLDCITRQVELPSTVSQLCKLSMLADNDFQRRFWQVFETLARLQALGINGKAGNPEIFKGAIALEQQAVLLMESMPQIYELNSVSVFSLQVPDHRTIQAWNTLRLIRMNINELILNEGSCLLLRDTSVVNGNWVATCTAAASKTLAMLAEQICDSVPDLSQDLEFGGAGLNRDMWVCSLTLPLASCANSVLLPPRLNERARLALANISRSTNCPSIHQYALQIDQDTGQNSGLHVLYLS